MASAARVWQTSLLTWQQNVLQDMQCQVALFVPIQLANFTVVPPHFRVPVVVSGGFFFVMYLSFCRGEGEDDVRNNDAEVAIN